MIRVQRCQRRDGDNFASRGPVPKQRGLIIGSLLRLRGQRILCAENIQGGRGGGPVNRIRADREGPGSVAVEAPAAVDTPVLRLFVHGAAVRAMHNRVWFLELRSP